MRRQAEAGVCVVNDGEASKIRYSTYVKERLDGFGGQSGPGDPHPDAAEFPDFVDSVSGGGRGDRPACIGPLAYRDLDAVSTDIANLQAAIANVEVDDAFMTAASPGVIARFLENQYYPGEEEYLFALAEVMKVEYDAIHLAGLVLQLDCPDLTARRHHAGEQLDEFRRRVELHIQALNHATRDIPGEAMRLHLCWGNAEAPISTTCRSARLSTSSSRRGRLRFPSRRQTHAMPMSGHCSKNWKLPGGKVLIPGVVDSTTNYVEHPNWWPSASSSMRGSLAAKT